MTVVKIACPKCQTTRSRIIEVGEEAVTLQCRANAGHEFTVPSASILVDVTGESTYHGDNIAGQIQDEDAYGLFDVLTARDVWNILDQLHSHYCTFDSVLMRGLLDRWMEELTAAVPGARG